MDFFQKKKSLETKKMGFKKKVGVKKKQKS